MIDAGSKALNCVRDLLNLAKMLSSTSALDQPRAA
jgi:hypothetical protein